MWTFQDFVSNCFKPDFKCNIYLDPYRLKFINDKIGDKSVNQLSGGDYLLLFETKEF